MDIVSLVGGILITLLFTAGSRNSETPYVTVPINYSPRSYLSKDSTTLLVINQFDADKVKASSLKKRGMLKAEALASIKYAESQFKQLPKVKVISLVDSAFAANTDSVGLLATQYKADHVLALKNLDADLVLSDVQSSTPYFSTNIDVDFKLYESNGLYYKKLRGAANDLIPDVKYLFGFYGALYIHPPVEKYRAYVDTSTLNAAQDALQDYFPTSISHDRPLYNDHFLRAAVKKIYVNDLDGAIVLLKPELQNKNRKKASKAAYNLAVVYEGKADIQTALAMARLSIKKSDNPYASAILEDLKVE